MKSLVRKQISLQLVPCPSHIMRFPGKFYLFIYLFGVNFSHSLIGRHKYFFRIASFFGRPVTIIQRSTDHGESNPKICNCTSQLLHLMLRENNGRGGGKIVRGGDQEVCFEIVSPRNDREVTPMTLQNYGC